MATYTTKKEYEKNFGPVLTDLFEHIGDCYLINKDKPNSETLVSSCVYSTFCPVEADNLTACYQQEGATVYKCYAQETLFARCLSKLAEDPTKLSEDNQIKFLYLNKLKKNEGPSKLRKDL
ncbi:hypothetical protein CYY_009584 [Polysphondylium violaceum]|uniref:CHCH domain-containing protein n=1 Tax=Polysphondylium violaceum TaxID=133409 RepID=A0A8J4PLF6_9MYCE|nr:hypothetical protein CYY_009584 [Polysphondylium violaceum]